jgi:thiol-disulfide isomerase/thioredoxin
MSGTEPPAARRGGVLRLALLAVIAVGAAAVLYVMFASSIKPGAGQGLERFARGGMEKLRVIEEPRAIPAVRIADEAGRMVNLAEIPGEVVVVNLWATWCAPCIAEMPTLAALQQAYPGRVTVVPVSLDKAPRSRRRRPSWRSTRRCASTTTRSGSVADAAKARAGLPTTIIYGRTAWSGRGWSGIAEWDSKEARGLFDALLAP